jgi:diaminopimelate decarboxylase
LPSSLFYTDFWTVRYGAQHPIVVLKESDEKADYVVVGHCCESGDLFTCSPGDPEVLLPRTLNKAKIGDLVTVEGCGAYCSSMSTKNYNSFPESAEVLLTTGGELKLIRR